MTSQVAPSQASLWPSGGPCLIKILQAQNKKRKIFVPKEETLPGRLLVTIFLLFLSPPRHTSSPLCLLLHLEPSLFAREAHYRTLLMAWSWMQDALHIQTALTSVMLIACLCSRPLLPIISDGLLA